MNSKFKLDIENDFLECINLTKYHLRLLWDEVIRFSKDPIIILKVSVI